MPDRPDLREISGSIREALEGKSREELLEILTYVFKEYVVEGPPPLLVSQAERIEDLEGLGFGALIQALQTRLDLPELSLFAVDGDQVSVRVGGVMTPLTGPGSATTAAARPPSASGGRATDGPVADVESEGRAAEPRPPRPRVQVVETDIVRRPQPSQSRDSVDEAVQRGRGDLAGAGTRPSAPRPPSGLSIRGRPAQPAPSSTESQQPSSTEGDNDPAEPAQPAENEGAGDGDDASVRFSLLELD